MEIKSLETCNFAYVSFEEILGRIQKYVDDLSLHQYSNLLHWVTKLDAMVEAKLGYRLMCGLQEWTKVLLNQQDEERDLSMDTDAPAQVTHKPGGEPKIRVNILLTTTLTYSSL